MESLNLKYALELYPYPLPKSQFFINRVSYFLLEKVEEDRDTFTCYQPDQGFLVSNNPVSKNY